MQFKVPQFLEIEDKIFGPFTFRQFAYLAGGAGLSFVLYRWLGFLWAIIPILLVAGFSLMLTFYRPNNKPFIDVLEAGFKYLTQSKLYIWKKRLERNKEAAHSENGKEKERVITEKLNESKLRDLAWSLNVLDMSKQKDNNQ